jgi:hypothetical protein
MYAFAIKPNFTNLSDIFYSIIFQLTPLVINFILVISHSFVKLIKNQVLAKNHQIQSQSSNPKPIIKSKANQNRCITKCSATLTYLLSLEKLDVRVSRIVMAMASLSAILHNKQIEPTERNLRQLSACLSPRHLCWFPVRINTYTESKNLLYHQPPLPPPRHIM